MQYFSRCKYNILAQRFHFRGRKRCLEVLTDKRSGRSRGGSEVVDLPLSSWWCVLDQGWLRARPANSITPHFTLALPTSLPPGAGLSTYRGRRWAAPSSLGPWHVPWHAMEMGAGGGDPQTPFRSEPFELLYILSGNRMEPSLNNGCTAQVLFSVGLHNRFELNVPRKIYTQRKTSLIQE